MAFFNNKRKDFSIQPPKQEIANGAFTVTDSPNIDFTYALNNLTADLTLTGVTAGTYGDATNVASVTVDIFGRITGVTLIPISGGSSISGTPTRIPFFDSVSSLADDSNLYWDNVNKAVIIGASSTPSAAARLYLFSSTNNADVFIETIYNQRLKFKNSNSGVQWHTSTNVFEDIPGTPRDSFNIGQSSNPALGYLEILKSGRVKIGGNIAGIVGFTDTVMLELGLTGVRNGQILLNALTSGNLQLKANDTTTPYTFTFPTDAGSSGEVLKTDGAGVTYWDTGGGGGGTYTADNGLTEDPSNNFRLGSTIAGGAPLLHDTYIDTLTDKTLFLEGQKTNLLEYILDVTNAANDGNAILASALGLGTALRATSVSASAVSANSTNAPAIAASTGGSNEAGLFTNSDTGTNNIIQAIRLRHSSSGVPTAGFGIAAEFSGKTTLNSDLRLGRLSFVWEDAITASRTSKFQIHTVNSGVEEVKVEVLGDGQTKLNKYGLGTFTGTPTYYAAWDTNGNFIEEPIPGGGGGSQLNETTGILYGGNLSSAIGGTTFSVTAGIGQIVTQTASISGIATTVNNVTWSAVSGAAITNIGTSQFTYILVDNTGAVIQQTTPFTDAQHKTHIIIGILCHIDFASVNLVTNAQNVAYEDPHRLVELITAFGPIKKTGLNIGPNGANLRVNRTSGEAFKIGANYITDQFEPDVATIAAQTPAKLCRVHRDGSGGFIFDTFGGVYYDDIDPNQYDDGSGTLAPVPSNRWTIQRLFFFPNNPNDIICYYGVQLYNNFSEARANLEFETFDEAQITAENAVFLGFLFVRHNATDLTDPTFAAFLQSGLFRGIPPGGGGSGGGGNSIGELTGDVTAGPATSSSQSVSSTLKTNLRVGSVGVTVDGVTSVIQVGQVGYVEMPYDGSITNWSITGNAAGSIIFDVWKASGVIPTVANTMIGLGTKPSLSSQQINLGVPTGWTTVNFLAGDILGFYVDSASTLKRATLTLRTNKT